MGSAKVWTLMRNMEVTGLLEMDVCQCGGLEQTCLTDLHGTHLSYLPREEELRRPTG